MDQEAEQLQQVLCCIYDCALDRTLRVAALKEIARFVGGCAGALYAKDAYSKTGATGSDFGISDEYKKLYYDEYIKLDPCTVRQYFAEIDEPVTTEDILPYEEFVQTRFYQEWVHPQGLVDTITTILEKSATGANFLTIYRGERDGLADEIARRRMRLVAPHVRRGFYIAKLVRAKAMHESAPFGDALDCLKAAIFMLNASGRIIHCNAAALAMLNVAEIVRPVRGHVVATCPRAQRALSDVLSATRNGDAAAGTRGIAVPLTTTDGQVFVAHVMPLTSDRRRAVVGSPQVTAALFIDKATLGTQLVPDAIANHYGLTPSELRVLLATVEVGRIAEVAEKLGVAESTVRTHLGRLYDKTGAERQPDLVKLVARFSTPLMR